jgi:hypothetical protein
MKKPSPLQQPCDKRTAHEWRMLRKMEQPRRKASGSRHWNEHPVCGCQIGTRCPILHAKQDQVHPIGCLPDKNPQIMTEMRTLKMAAK